MNQEAADPDQGQPSCTVKEMLSLGKRQKSAAPPLLPLLPGCVTLGEPSHQPKLSISLVNGQNDSLLRVCWFQREHL